MCGCTLTEIYVISVLISQRTVSRPDFLNLITLYYSPSTLLIDCMLESDPYAAYRDKTIALVNKN